MNRGNYDVFDLPNGKCVWLQSPVSGDIIKEALTNEFPGVDFQEMIFEVHPYQQNTIILSRAVCVNCAVS